MLIAFAYMRPGSGRRLGMVGGGGGRSVLTADLCEELGLDVPPPPADVERRIADKAPDLAGWVTNPVDQSILAGSGVSGAQVLHWMDESPGIDLLLATVGAAWARGGGGGGGAGQNNPRPPPPPAPPARGVPPGELAPTG